MPVVMKKSLSTVLRRLSAAGLCAWLAAGCSTTAMKGTPFFTGEYATRKGPPENRLNLWPLAYYRDPALSILWPLGEYTGDRLAVRPFFSIENLQEEHAVYNVLWPLGRFDTRRGDHRFFPFFWGRDYRVAFPLYWHYDQPLGRQAEGSDSLWPLWLYFRDHHQHSLHLLWPVFNVKSYDNEKGWRVWPLAGRYERPRARRGHAYALWPLAWHTWAPREESWTLLPIFHTSRDTQDRSVQTLLGGWTRDASGASTDWWALPILGGGSRSPQASRASALLGLYGHHRDAVSRGSRLLPLYYHKASDNLSLFLSPLYLSRSSPGAGGWSLVPPLGLYRHSESGSSFHSLLYSQGADRAKARRWSCLLPLYYADRDPEGASFVTALGGWWTERSGRSWAVYPLLSGGRRRADGGDLWIGGPLFHASWNAQGRSHWLLPLYAYDHAGDTFLSLPYSSWTTEDDRTVRLFPPLLSSYTGGASRWDLWTLGGLGHFSGGEQAGTSHLVPLYYGNRRTGTRLTPLYAAWEADSGRMRFIPPLLTAWRVNDARRTETFLSPLYATWEDDIGRLRAIPPLLSASYRDGDRRGIVGLLGLFHARWGGEAGRRAGHLLPLYYFDDQTFLTPLAGSLKTDGTTSRYWLTPLLGTRSGGTRGSWLFPLYSHTAQPDLQTSQGWFLLAGEYRRAPREDLTRFPLLFKHQRWRGSAGPAGRGPHDRQGWRFNALLLAHGASLDYTETRLPTAALDSGSSPRAAINEPMHRGESGLFPLWNYQCERSATGRWTRASGNLLLALFDYRHEQGRAPPDPAPHDYSRWRVLFRLYHHERLNGATSIDLFPAITIDRDPAAGKRKVSFLWRLFRYERAPGSRAVDLLFLPVWRGRPDPPAS